jgi:hypothetical protein
MWRIYNVLTLFCGLDARRASGLAHRCTIMTETEPQHRVWNVVVTRKGTRLLRWQERMGGLDVEPLLFR